VKRTVFAAFIAFWAFVAAVLALAVLVPDGESVAPAAAASEPRRIGLAEVAGHAGERSCWMAIEGEVFDLTAYLGHHPAPPAVMLAWCGREATAGMRTKGYGRDHSPRAWSELEQYRIGVLAEP
jgi:cytochrome b involved in lipid metabolism